MVGNNLVGLTDWLVAVLSIFYSTYFVRERNSRYHILWFYYFIFSAIGCLIAGAYHIFVPEYIPSPYSDWLWILTLWLVGVVSFIGFNILFYYLLPRVKPKSLLLLSIIIYGGYAVFTAQHPIFKYASLFFGMMVIGQILISLYFWIKTYGPSYFIR